MGLLKSGTSINDFEVYHKGNLKEATTTVNGLLSITDKIKLNSLNKIEKSAINGNIKINGIETIIYAHSSNHDDRYFTETELTSTIDGNSGANKIGVRTITGLTGTNVQTILENLKAQIDNKSTSLTAGTGLSLSNSIMSLATSGVTAGTYKSIVVDAYGRVTAGTNPTTLSGYGIADAYTKTETDTRIQSLINSAPGTLDTLNELAAALGNDPNFATTITTQLSNKVDKITGKGLSTEDYTAAEKTKLAGIATSANNYTHPSTHPASIITQDATHRFLTDTERTNWNAKETTSGAQSKATTAESNAIAHANNLVGIKIIDTRSVAPIPSAYTANRTTSEFKTSSIMGISGVGTYVHVFTERAWSDISGGYIRQVALDGSSKKIFTRYGDQSNDTWSNWDTLENTVDSQAKVDLHANSKSNPHQVTKAQVSLGNVDNIQQATKTEFNTHNTDTTKHITAAERTTWNGKANTSVATTSVNGLMSSTDKTKLDGIATGANKYVHPSNHPASIITQDSSHRFISDQTLSNINNGIASAQEKADLAFQSASDGKTAIAAAITGKGISASSSDTFSVLASKISNISSSKQASGTFNIVSGYSDDIITNWKPKVVIITSHKRMAYTDQNGVFSKIENVSLGAPTIDCFQDYGFSVTGSSTTTFSWIAFG